MIEQPTSSLSNKFNQLIIIIILLLLLIFGISINLKDIVRTIFPASPTAVEVQRILIGNLQSKDELTTITLNTKATVKTSESRRILDLPIGTSNLIYEGIAQVQAGLNISQLQVQNVDNKTHTISIQLPPPRIIDVSLDISNSHIIDKYNQWMSPGEKISLQTKAQREVLQIAKSQACNQDILQSANQSAAKLIRGILTNAGYQEINIETQKGQCS